MVGCTDECRACSSGTASPSYVFYVFIIFIVPEASSGCTCCFASLLSVVREKWQVKTDDTRSMSQDSPVIIVYS